MYVYIYTWRPAREGSGHGCIYTYLVYVYVYVYIRYICIYMHIYIYSLDMETKKRRLRQPTGHRISCVSSKQRLPSNSSLWLVSLLQNTATHCTAHCNTLQRAQQLVCGVNRNIQCSFHKDRALLTTCRALFLHFGPNVVSSGSRSRCIIFYRATLYIPRALLWICTALLTNVVRTS